ncbi:ferredoxin [Thermospira aquatica]|uniref:Ferredoxin n=1 Tax=Thermospira aquatica TaxID=2828656 RepID=A0AAX3BBS8_9SPIR|nr:ferredoxin [Thermospira aquatica]URA09719.1 ferredoxin [Thermospira aquatica]
MAVTIDQNTCIGCGVCESIYVELFEMRADGKAHVKENVAYDVSLAEDAARQCPVGAISVEKE